MTHNIFWCVTNQSGTYFNDRGLFSNALSHISYVLKWSGTSPSVYGLLRKASSHIFCALKWPGTWPKWLALSLTNPLHISAVFNQSGTSFISQQISLTTFWHISTVKNLPRILETWPGLTLTTSWHIFCVLRQSGRKKNLRTYTSDDIMHFMYTLRPLVRSKYTIRWSFLYQIILKTTICYFHNFSHLQHVPCFLRRSEIQINHFGMTCIISLHLSCALRWSKISDGHGPLLTASLHISCVLKQSGTNANKVGSILTASLHISCILKWSGTSSNNNEYFSTASMHMSCFLKQSGQSMIIGLFRLLCYTFLVS